MQRQRTELLSQNLRVQFLQSLLGKCRMLIPLYPTGIKNTVLLYVGGSLMTRSIGIKKSLVLPFLVLLCF